MNNQHSNRGWKANALALAVIAATSAMPAVAADNEANGENGLYGKVRATEVSGQNRLYPEIPQAIAPTLKKNRSTNESVFNGVLLPQYRIAVAGDSITKAFAADCKANRWFWDLFCPAGGDQEQHSWFDGSSSNVFSIVDRYKNFDSTTTANHSAAASGSEMRGGNNNFAVQAQNIVNQADQANHVEVLLGGNDLCNRGCVDGVNCSDPVYSDAQWRESVRAGLDILMDGMPAEGSSVLLGGVPRVQDIRQAGLDLQAQKSSVNCEPMWNNFNVCRIVTNGNTMNGESVEQRHAGVAAAQQRYNAIIAEEAVAYNSNANGRNPNGIEVTSEYVDESTASAGTFSFGAEHLNGGDCFHPNVATQGLIADMLWAANANKPQ